MNYTIIAARIDCWIPNAMIGVEMSAATAAASRFESYFGSHNFCQLILDSKPAEPTKYNKLVTLKESITRRVRLPVVEDDPPEMALELGVRVRMCSH